MHDVIRSMTCVEVEVVMSTAKLSAKNYNITLCLINVVNSFRVFKN